MSNYLIHYGVGAEARKHKYISRRKINGKWYYYYDVGDAGFVDGNGGREKDGQRSDSSTRGFTKVEDILGKDEKMRYERSEVSMKRKEEAMRNAFNKANDASWMDKDLENKSKKADSDFKESYDKWTNDQKAFYKTPLGKLEQSKDVIQSGKNKVAELLEKKAKKLRK